MGADRHQRWHEDSNIYVVSKYNISTQNFLRLLFLFIYLHVFVSIQHKINIVLISKTDVRFDFKDKNNTFENKQCHDSEHFY